MAKSLPCRIGSEIPWWKRRHQAKKAAVDLGEKWKLFESSALLSPHCVPALNVPSGTSGLTTETEK